VVKGNQNGITYKKANRVTQLRLWDC